MIRLLFIFFFISLIGGVVGGLQLAWGPLATLPGGYSPADLRRREKEAYIDMVASAYVIEQDVGRATERLDLLNAGNTAAWAAERARAAATNGEGSRAYRLATLAIALGVEDAALQQLAQPALAEGTRWRWVGQNELTCTQVGAGDTAVPLLILRAESVTGDPLPNVEARLATAEGQATVLRTNGDGVAQLPFAGVGTLTLSDGLVLPVDTTRFDTPCTRLPTALMGLQLTVRPR